MSKKLKVKVGLAEKPQVVEIEVPDQELPVWDLDAKLAVVGKRISRVEGPEKVTGEAKYTLDYTPKDLPGLLYGRILRSPYPHARVERIDATKAQALPGVKAVLLFDKGEGFNPGEILSVMSDGPGAEPRDRVVIFAGEEVAAVAAESEAVAEDALRLIDVKYRRLPHVVDHEEAIKPGAPIVHKGMKDNIRRQDPQVRGDVEQGFKEAEVTIERTFRVPVLLHNSPECHVAVAKWEGKKLTVWASTQGVNGFREELANTFKIPKADVRVIMQHMGGGFGSKFGMQAYGAVAAALARKAGAPVKLGYDRHEENLAAGNRPDATIWVKLGAKKDGTLTALQCRSYGTAG
ncbi:MAG: molybdopterin-dependent oxidoreductase, partial [Acidobacteriia bacterium]|nr:molybdopterin-dependent oxidoreductase [Terriglobia bacterium]